LARSPRNPTPSPTPRNTHCVSPARSRSSSDCCDRFSTSSR
jgi:hypothetical protein